jgi:hypothetical protein
MGLLLDLNMASSARDIVISVWPIRSKQTDLGLYAWSNATGDMTRLQCGEECLMIPSISREGRPSRSNVVYSLVYTLRGLSRTWLLPIRRFDFTIEENHVPNMLATHA